MALFGGRSKQTVTASAEVVKLDLSNPSKGHGRGPTDKQKKAWHHYDNIPEMWYAHNYVANALRRIRIYPAIQPDPAAPPIPLTPTDGSIGALANAELDRLRDEDGSHGSFMHDTALQLLVPGEGLLASYDDEDGDEKIIIASTAELKRFDDVWKLVDSDDGRDGEELGKDVEAGGNVLVNRFWRPHPKFRKKADSAFFPLAGTLDELLLLDQLYRSNARSRIPNGVILVPEELQLKDRARSSKRPNQQPGQQGELDPFVKSLLTALLDPIGDEESAGNVAPGVIKMKGDLIEQIKPLIFGRPFDAETAARYDRCIKRAGDGSDIPSHIVTGAEDLNHWSLWYMDEDAFDSHMAPLTQLICSAAVQAFFGPAMEAVTGNDPSAEKVFIWYDASGLLAHPNKSADADKAYENYTISGESYRRIKGYDESDKPDEQEIAERIRISQEIRASSQPTTSPPGPPNDGTPPGQSLIASALLISELGLEMARLDHDLRVQLQAAAEGVVIRALDQAGAKMRARRPDSFQLEGVSNIEVCRVLGPDEVHAFVTNDELLDGAIAPLLPVYTRIVSRVQRLMRSIVGDYDPELDLTEMEQRQDADRQRGAEVLTAGLLATLTTLLFSPAVDAPARGEIDDTFTVPAGVLRDALSAAGGSNSSTAVNPVTSAPEGGVATGDTVQGIFYQIGITPSGWRWVYGDSGSRKTVFEGHANLDGTTFLDWQDEALRVQAGDEWLGREFYSPGDHLYCQCDFAPVMEDNPNVQEPDLVEA